jgi:hypothetical protein
MVKRIIIGTSLRCGSTMLFNSVRNIYYFFTNKKIWAGWVTKYKENMEYISNNYDVVIVKTHYDELEINDNDIVFTIHRDIVESAHSQKRYNSETNVEDNIKEIEKFRNIWDKKATHTFNYNTIMNMNKGLFAKKLMEVLNIENKFIDINTFIEKNICPSFLLPNNKYIVKYNFNDSCLDYTYFENGISPDFRKYKYE